MLEKVDNALHTNDNIHFCNEDFDTVTFIANQRHILAVDFDTINVDNSKIFYEDDPDTITDVRLFVWCTKF